MSDSRRPTGWRGLSGSGPRSVDLVAFSLGASARNWPGWHAMSPAAIRTKRLKRALAHQCPSCRRHWALQLVEHPSGKVVLCRYCRAIRHSVPARMDPRASNG